MLCKEELVTATSLTYMIIETKTCFKWKLSLADSKLGLKSDPCIISHINKLAHSHLKCFYHYYCLSIVLSCGIWVFNWMYHVLFLFKYELFFSPLVFFFFHFFKSFLFYLDFLQMLPFLSLYMACGGER